MNIFNTPQIQTAGKGGSPSTDVLDVLGNSLQLDEASLKLLEQNGDLDGMGFDELLKLNEKNPKALEELVSKAQAKQADALAQLSSGSTEVSEEVLLENNSEKANILQLGKSEFTTAQNTSSAQNNISAQKQSTTNSDLNSILNFNKNAETAEVAKAQVNKSAQPQVAGTQEANMLKEQLGIQNATKAQFAKEPVLAQAAIANNTETNKEAKNNKLMGLNEFMGNQPKSVQKRAAAQTAYKPMTKSMFNQKIEATTPAVTQEKVTSLQDIMFGGQEKGAESSFEQALNQPQTAKAANKVNTAQAANNVFNINDLQGAKTTDEVITKIQDYVIQSKVANQQEVKMSFQHQELGKIDLLVEKAQNNALNISIGARSVEGARFFSQNQGELVATLTQAGVNVGEFKLDSSQGSNNQNSSESSKQQFGQNGQKNHQSQSGQQDEDSRRREELWSSYQDKEVA